MIPLRRTARKRAAQKEPNGALKRDPHLNCQTSAWYGRRVDLSVPPPYPEGRGLLTGKTIVITAAAGAGIGGATARRCLDEGARVVVSDAHERRLTAVAADLA